MKISSFINENKVEIALFAVLWTLIILRSFLVFYIHDEIVSKYAYMLTWKLFPFQGYIDANNHFLNSLLGGFFIRVLNSEAIWVSRLGSVLAFPIYYWSIVGFKRYFQHRAPFYLLLVSLCCTTFILDFFSLARGYALAWSFLLLALLYTAHYLKQSTTKNLLIGGGAWLIAIYANLSILTVAVIGLLLLMLITFQKNRWHSLFTLFYLLVSFWFVYYAFHLQEIGKLYLGNKENFITTTLHDLSELLFSIEATLLDSFLFCVATLIFLKLVYSLYRQKLMIQPNQLFYLFFVVSVLSIFAQNILLGVNFPEDRSAAFLVIFFYGSVGFYMDHPRLKHASWALSAVVLIYFLLQVNLTHTRTFYYEHMDRELISKIPPVTKGIPTSTGGRFWNMDNELIKAEKFPIYTFQASGFREDTLTDYIIHRPSLRPYIEEHYTIQHQDTISGLTLYRRNNFLERELSTDLKLEVESDQVYINLPKVGLQTPCFIRVTGEIGQLDFYDRLSAVIKAKDSLSGEDHFTGTLTLTERRSPNDAGMIPFDFTYTIKRIPTVNQLLVFLHNKEKMKLNGSLRVRVYQAY